MPHNVAVTTSDRARRGVSRRTRLVSAALVSALVGLLAPATPATAGSVTWWDAAGDNGPATPDLRQHRLELDGSTLRFTAWFDPAQPLVDARLEITMRDPARPGVRLYGSLTAGEPSQPGSFGWSEGEDSGSCSVWTEQVDGRLTAAVPASCIGSPRRLTWHVEGWRDERGKGLALMDAGGEIEDALGVSVDGPVDPIPRQAVRRWWSPGFADAHFFSASPTEAQALADDTNWVYENVAFAVVPFEDDRCEGGAPVHRFWSDRFRTHFWTIDAAEAAHITANDRNWRPESIAWCAYGSPRPTTVPLHRFWSPVRGKHFFTADVAESDWLRATQPSWSYEGVAFHVMPVR